MTGTRPVCAICARQRTGELTDRWGPWPGVCSVACRRAAELEIERVNGQLDRAEAALQALRELVDQGLAREDEFGRNPDLQIEALMRRIEGHRLRQLVLLRAITHPADR